MAPLFATRYIDDGRPDRLEVIVRPERPADPQGDATQLFDAVQAWIDVARAGGMAGDDIDPVRSGLVLDSRELSVEGECRWLFKDVRIDPRALQILENVLNHVHLGGTVVREVVVVGGIVDRFQQWGGELPPVHQPVPFAYEYSATDFFVWVEVEFDADQEDVVFAQLERRVEAWGGLCAFSGYAEPTATERSYLYIDSKERFADLLLLSLPRRHASDHAFDGFVNLLQLFHDRVAPLRAVRVM